MVNTDTVEKLTIFDFGQGGLFYFSPDGAQVALSTPEHWMAEQARACAVTDATETVTLICLEAAHA